jgi:hypothetical protein
MIYEYRKYIATPGKLAKLNQMFAEPITKLFDRHGMDVLAYWTPVVGASSISELHYILKWPDMTTMQQRWASFYADPDWAEAGAEFQGDGPLVSEAQNQVWALTPYSPIP